jgi:Ohr subfamily peroxiredoxin
MKTLFSSEATADGARSGSVSSPDGLLNVQLGNPLEPAIAKRGPNPELLFAGAYAACYHGALLNAAEALGVPAEGSTVRAVVSLKEDESGGYHLSVELHASIPGALRVDVQSVMDAAHATCPYSRLTRGQASVKLVPDA